MQFLGTDFVKAAISDGIQLIFVLFQHQFLTEILRFRAQNTPDHNIFTLLNSKVSLKISW